MPDNTVAHPAKNPSCAFIQFSELFRFPAHTVGHLNMCDAMTTLGVETTLYMLPPLDGPTPSPEALAAAYGLSHEPRIAWVRPDANKWVARLRILWETSRLGRHSTFTYSTRGITTLGALLGGARMAVLEIHQPASFWAHHDRVALRLARRSKQLRIVCISKRLAEIVAQEWGFEESTIIVEHSGHNFPIRDDYRAESGNGRRLRAMYVGSFQPGKGVQTVFEIAHLHPEVDFVAVGGQAPHSGLPDNVSVRPRVAHADVADLLSEADILLMPFNTYSGSATPSDAQNGAEQYYSPLKMVEYLSAGRAIVSSDLPSIAEVLVDGSNCLLVEPDSLPAWSAAIGRLEGDPNLREHLARGAAQAARRHTTVERARRILSGLGVRT